MIKKILLWLCVWLTHNTPGNFQEKSISNFFWKMQWEFLPAAPKTNQDGEQ